MFDPTGVDPKRALEQTFGAPKYVIGVVHLLPLPGSPRWKGQMSRVLKRAVADARALESGGVDGLIVENRLAAGNPWTARRRRPGARPGDARGPYEALGSL